MQNTKKSRKLEDGVRENRRKKYLLNSMIKHTKQQKKLKTVTRWENRCGSESNPVEITTTHARTALLHLMESN